jgi:hypothetical protein
MSDSEYEHAKYPSAVYRQVLNFVDQAQANEQDRRQEEMEFIEQNHEELQQEFQHIVDMIHELGVRDTHEVIRIEEGSDEDADEPSLDSDQDIPDQVLEEEDTSLAMAMDTFVQEVSAQLLDAEVDVTALFYAQGAGTYPALGRVLKIFGRTLIRSMPLDGADRSKVQQTFETDINHYISKVGHIQVAAAMKAKRAAASI